MRLQWLWVFSALAMIGAIVVPWGEKHVVDLECKATWDQGSLSAGERCYGDDWKVAYRPLSMETSYRDYTPSGTRDYDDWAYAYDDPGAPYPEGIGPLLEFGGATMLASLGVMTVTSVVYHVRRHERIAMLARVGWGIHAGALLSFLGGIAYHAGTWRAEEVSNLSPSWGLLCAAATLLVGVPLLPERQTGGMPALPDDPLKT